MNFLAEKLGIRKSFLYLLFLVLILFFFTFFLKIEIAEIKSKKENIIHLENQLSMIEKKVRKIDNDGLRELEHRTQEFKRQYDLGLESQLVLLDAYNFALQANLEIIGFNSLDKKDYEDYKHRQYILTFMGDFSQFLSWLKLMEEMPYYININDLYIGKHIINENNTKIPKTGEKIVFRVTINNIALDDNLPYGNIDPQYFRHDPFSPGIGTIN